ncbi:MAG: N-acetyl-gamma-glutamyl-phosphate reductase [Planctomycetota bacterium]
MSDRHRIGIIGVSGYGGGEALRLVAQHPDLDLAAVYGHGSTGKRLGEMHPALVALSPDVAGLKIEPFDPPGCDVDLLLASMPTGSSRDALAAVPENVKIVDIGGDHRFIDGWSYGLADVAPDDIRQATRIANPGCYPTAALLALVPLQKAGLINNGQIIVDAKSGVSGAGRGGGEQLGYADTNESLHAYKPLVHGHEPEIAQGLGRDVAFVPHLVPITRGLLATCYVPSTANANECVMAARALYETSPFVRVTDQPPKTKWASGSNMAFVHYAADEDRALLVATCAIDNLGKGAAGQAVQNANLMLGLAPDAGLRSLPAWP